MMRESYSRVAVPATKNGRPLLPGSPFTLNTLAKGKGLLIGIVSMMSLLVFSCASRTSNVPHRPAAETEKLIQSAQDAERNRDYNQARALYQRALDSAPNAKSAAFAAREMASALVFWGEYPAAMELLLLSLKHIETQAPVWHDLGVLRARFGTLPGAKTALSRAVELAPNSPRACIALAALLVKMKEYRSALSQYRRLRTLKTPTKIQRATERAIKLLQAEIQLQEQ